MTITISLRIEENYVKFLKRKAHQMSLDKDIDITVSDLLKESLEKIYPFIKQDK